MPRQQLRRGGARSPAYAARALPSVLRRRVNSARTIPSKFGGAAITSVIRQEIEPHHRGGDLRRRTERAGRQGEQVRHPRTPPEQHGQHSVIARARRRHEPVGHLLLQHHRRVADPAVGCRAPRAAGRESATRCCREGCPPRGCGAPPREAAARGRSRRSRMSPWTTPHVRRRADRESRRRGRGPARCRSPAAPTLAIGSVSAPAPGPISRITSSGCGATAATTFRTQTSSRKCCPNRLRALTLASRADAEHPATPAASSPSSSSPFHQRSSIASISSSERPK